MICRHCKSLRVSRPRGLCWSCYYTDGVREQYPPTSKYGHRGPGNIYRRARLPTFPTSALPGTPEKVAVMEQRAQLRQSLFHPGDAALDRRAVLVGEAG